MARWAGWGAGPAGAGAAGPTKAFIVVMIVVAGFTATRFLLMRHWPAGLLSVLVTAYFVLRLVMVVKAGRK
ncbi:MAG TPA: hypothetical protein VFK85_01120 [Anaeromyxobacteraceae bacterium]|nr:hypothetical protein [Anaeromyxobacteraceae bacterium]